VPPVRGAEGGATGPKRVGPELRRKLLAAIAAQRERRLAAQGTAAANPDRTGTLDKDYIRERMQDLMPLVKECYDNALRDHPDLRGRLVVEFTLSGEPGAGAIIEDSKILDGSIENAPLRECVQETMYALELKAPDEGGRIVVRYPFELEVHGP